MYSRKLTRMESSLRYVDVFLSCPQDIGIGWDMTWFVDSQSLVEEATEARLLVNESSVRKIGGYFGGL